MVLYPNTAGNSCITANAFFSPIPRAVLDLRGQGKLISRDVEVLSLLLDYKVHSSPIVDPPQEELADRLACSKSTIERSVARLRQAGLVATERLHDLRGRLGRILYDLSAVLALMPVQAARMRGGQWGKSAPAPAAPPAPVPDGNPRKSAAPNPKSRAPKPPVTTPHSCGVSESGDSDVKKDNTPAPAPRAPAPSAPPEADPTLAAVVVALKEVGVFAAYARTLAQKCGEERCRAVLAAAACVKHFRQSRAAWVVGALTHEWSLPPAAAETRPQSQWAYQPPPADPPPPADLADLAPDAYAALKEKARALLWEETHPAWRQTLLNGSNPAYLRDRMRQILAAERESRERESREGESRR